MMLARLQVAAIARPSPSFIRLELAGPDLADFGVDGPLFDQRFKLVLPGPAGLPTLRAESWWTDFTALPEETRGVIRTYTVADVVGSGEDTRLVVDVVLHPGAHGPGSAWATAAEIGDEVLGVLPKRGMESGGIEFEPGDAERLLLVGDETALPAIHQILRELPPREGRTGTVLLEVPCAEDICDLPAVDGVEVTWLPRGQRAIGEPMIEAVSAHLGLAREAAAAAPAALPVAAPVPVAGGSEDDMPWETPTYSALGETAEAVAPPVDGRYAWIAGEAGMVTTLRRHLVGQLGMPRRQVAFMGYWRQGVAMRS